MPLGSPTSSASSPRSRSPAADGSAKADRGSSCRRSRSGGSRRASSAGACSSSHHVVWADSLVHGRLNAPSSAPAGSAERRPSRRWSGRSRWPTKRRRRLKGSLGANFTRARTTTSSQAQPAPSSTASDCAMPSTARSSLPGSGSSGPRARFHDLRHTFGTLAVRVAPVTDVKTWMGHADLSTTMRCAGDVGG